VSFNHLFQQGLLELCLALEEPLFLQQHLPGVKPAAVAAFKSRLAGWPVGRPSSAEEARKQAREVVHAAYRDGIPVRSRLVCVLVLEFAAGACNGIDDYSAFLPPALTQPPRPGRVGVGMEVTAVADGIEVARVYKKGPAEEADVQEGDRVLRVAGQPVAHLHPETVAERLRGLPGTTVEVEFERPADDQSMVLRRPVKLTRRAVAMPSVDYRTEYLHGGLLAGYIRISYFGEWTLQEVKEAVAELSKPGGELKGLILDLRGNPGGLFHPAVTIAEMFLTEGVIVIGQSPYKEYNRPFKVETSGPLLMPLVVLVDGETASAAEVLAGALKEGRQGRLPTKVLGLTTYGKGAIQRLISIEKLLDRPAAIRLTVAKLFSPSNQPYTGRGVTPTHPTPLRGFQLLREALKELSALIAEQGPGPMPPMPRQAEMGDAEVVS
jgi:carboxyl-terminal processing protease